MFRNAQTAYLFLSLSCLMNNNSPYDDKWKASPGMQICPYVRYGIYSDDFQEVHKMVNGST
jgi:hypothetical protein